MANKEVEVTIKLNIPEEYELDDGKQPRVPKKGDIFWWPDKVDSCIAKQDSEDSIYFILKRTTPKYATLDFDGFVVKSPSPIDCTKKYIELQAVKDLMPIVRHVYELDMLGEDQAEIYRNLRSFLNEQG